MILLLTAALLVGVFMWRRRRRAARLAGLESSAPVFSVEPPRRRHSPLKGERL